MSIPISQKGFNRLREELETLKKERPVIAKIIQEAREEGDLSENAGYDAARERQGMLEARISYIESRMPAYNVVDLAALGGSKKVVYGATVRLVDQDTDEEKEYTIVGPDETDMVKGGISALSPVARALLGKEVGDEFVVDAPRGRLNYEIVDLEFKGEALFG
ncbi:transcription elongation factor GreA [Desulfovibrio sp. OttesenSCG-928-C14]|nr:transcription elongation factor GreA [Desulfovibrio sp. OttesenSCG-928-C14]